jgi:hypothetical protein
MLALQRISRLAGPCRYSFREFSHDRNAAVILHPDTGTSGNGTEGRSSAGSGRDQGTANRDHFGSQTGEGCLFQARGSKGTKDRDALHLGWSHWCTSAVISREGFLLMTNQRVHLPASRWPEWLKQHRSAIGPAMLGFVLVSACHPLRHDTTQASALESPAPAVPAGDPIGDEPLYLQVLGFIRTGDSVIPKAPPVHPLTATYNREAIVPPMCYTRTEGRYNPCYVCHQNSIPGRENTMNDGDLQEAYSFSDLGMTNHWRNLFEDREARIAAISDREVLEWIGQDNYSELAERLRQAGFEGWIPDLRNLQEGAAAFDGQGFALDGSHWVAFNYKPFPSTFWPTNGSTDDVMIRLAEPYRVDRDGEYSRDVYLANLSIVEMNIKGLESLDIPAIDERVVGDDLDGNGALGVAVILKKKTSYVGGAYRHIFLPGVYPQETEFLHTVRYVAVGANGEIQNSRRIKEVRYLKKWQAVNHAALAEYYREEGYSKDMGRLPAYANLKHYGLDNGMGWSVQSFIEDRRGRLRVNTYEENLFCMGCHNSIGAIIDKTFSFPRKLDGAAGWGYINLRGMPDAPNMGETMGEIATYFERVGGGDEFRSNTEMQQRWFNPDGSVNHQRVNSARDVYELITPSRERALMLNKAYRLIVEEQDYIFGRDATVTPLANVYQRVDNDTSPTLPPEAVHAWDIRLDWGKDTVAASAALGP